MSFTAKNKHGEIIAAKKIDRSDLRFLTDLTCPECGETVHFVNATEKQKHFRHNNIADHCQSYHAETPYHRAIKNLLAERLMAKYPDQWVFIEKKIEGVDPLTYPKTIQKSLDLLNEIKSRPDVMMVCPATGLIEAFELQRSKQTIKDYVERDRKYRMLGICCTWLIPENKFQKGFHDEMESHDIQVVYTQSETSWGFESV